MPTEHAAPAGPGPAQVLYDAAGLWCVAPGAGGPVLVRAACDALVQGLDTPSLRELAGLARGESGWVVQEVLDGALRELGLPWPDEPAAMQEAAVRGMARRLLAGEIGCRELTVWAHRVIGHDGVGIAQSLVDLDDRYHLVPDIAETAAELDTAITAEARRLVGQV